MNLRVLLSISVLAVIASANAAYTYVGAFNVAGGDFNTYYWQNNPLCYSAREAAALLYGGSYTDYAISTVSDQVADINHSAWVDGWGNDTYLLTPSSEDFKSGTYYNDSRSTFSAYVIDHGFDYGSSTPVGALNYVFRATPVPEPTSMAVLALGGAFIVQRRKKA